ncbi:hypothetical protein NHQ30_003466 [Ciborinia camelliae]|nr:hypothetical protein NHQ30_003466 [Ciborinia camelliae]
MSAVTSIVNKAVEDHASVHLYYNTTLMNLGLLLRNGKRSGPDPDFDFAGGPESNKGIIVDQSHLTSSDYEGVNLVLGLTEKPETDVLYDVSILSPSYEPLETTQSNRTSIASTATVDDLHVYYLNGSDDAKIKVRDYSYSTRTSSELPDTSDIIPGSCLAAYCIGSDRFVLYQGLKNKQLYEYNCSTTYGKFFPTSFTPSNSYPSDTPIKNATGAQDGTPIAVTCEKDTNKVFLYFVLDTLEIRRIVKEDNKWGPSLEVPGATKVLLGSKVSATIANEVNHVFYVEDKTSLIGVQQTPKFKHLRDPIPLRMSCIE